MKSFGKQYFYSPSTYNLLNTLTLQIKDKEIAREYELCQIQRFNYILKWILMGLAVILTCAWAVYFAGRSELYEALRPTHLMLNATILILARLFCTRHAAKFWIVAQLPTLILV